MENSPISKENEKGAVAKSKGIFWPTKFSSANSLILESRPPPPPPAWARPVSSPQRKGTVLYDYKGDKQFGEISRLKEGEEVTEVTPDDEGWSLVKTSKGAEGKAPTSYIEWKPQGDC